jgi:hypothetical protein
MIPIARKWKVTFYKHDGTVVSTTVLCVKRFAKSFANEELGYPAFYSHKITVGLIR